MRHVTEETRSERTARLLVARLDALAKIASGVQHAEAERLVELASVATMHAVALEILQAERADAIWREAHERHPQLPQVVLELPERLAA
jgi:ubiquinone biosynthesis protein COQ9